MVRHLEEDYPTQHYRMVSITNLSNDVTPSDILSKIAGGAVVSLALIKPALAGMPTTAHVNFVYQASAVNYAKYYQDQPLVINGQNVKVTHVLVSTVPAVINRVLKDSCTRCLKAFPVPSTMTAGDLRRELLMLDQCIESNIESIQLKDDGCIHLSFLNIETAIRVKEYLDKSFKYKNYNIHYDHDPCARRLQQVSHVQNAVQTPQPQLNALASGSYLRKPQIMNTTLRSPILMRKPGYHSYEDRDDTRATQVTSLDYDHEVVDSGVDTEMSTMKIRGEPVTSAVHKSLSLLDMDYNEGDEVVYMASLQGEIAGTTDKVNVAVTIDPATAGHQDEVAQSDGVDMSADPVSSVNHEKEHSLDMMVLEQSIVKTAGERHSSSTEQTASTSSNTPVPSFIDTFSPEPRSYAKPLSVPGRKDTLFDGNLVEVPTPCNQLLHNTLQPAGQRPIPAGIIELAKALLSVSEIPASSSAQAKCSESSEADDATSLRSSPGRDASVSTSSDSQQIDFQRSASPSPSPHLVTSSTIASTSTLSVAPRAALLHDSKYSPFAATSVPGRNSSPTPLQQNYRRHPSPPPFGFTFTPPVKSVQSKSRTGAVEAGVNPRGRKMVRYDDLYDTLPSTTITASADGTKDEGEKRGKTTTDSNAQQVMEEEVEISNVYHQHNAHTHTPNYEEKEINQENTDANNITNRKQNDNDTLEVEEGEIIETEHDHNYDGGDEDEEGEEGIESTLSQHISSSNVGHHR